MGRVIFFIIILLLIYFLLGSLIIYHIFFKEKNQEFKEERIGEKIKINKTEGIFYLLNLSYPIEIIYYDDLKVASKATSLALANNHNVFVIIKHSEKKTYGIKESKDILQIITYFNKRFNYQNKIILNGLGNKASYLLETLNTPLNNVVGVIAIASFDHYLNQINYEAKKKNIPSFFIKCFVRLACVLANFDPNDNSPRYSLALSKLPILLVTSLKDEIVPSEETKALLEKRKENITFLSLDNVLHHEYLDNENYLNAYNDFINQILK